MSQCFAALKTMGSALRAGGSSLTWCPAGGAAACSPCRQPSALLLAALLTAPLCSGDEKSETEFRIYYFSTAFRHSLIWDVFCVSRRAVLLMFPKSLSFCILLSHEKYIVSQDKSRNTMKAIIPSATNKVNSLALKASSCSEAAGFTQSIHHQVSIMQTLHRDWVTVFSTSRVIPTAVIQVLDLTGDRLLLT